MPMSESISPFIHRKVIVLRESSNVYEAVRAMCDHNVGSIVVSDGEGQISGIVTDRDLTCALASFDEIQDSTLGEVMTPNPVTVTESARIRSVIGAMKEHGIRRIPVVSEPRTGESRCIGMVSLDDLIVARMISAADLAEIVRAQVFRRRKGLPQYDVGEIRQDETAARFLEGFMNRTGFSEARALSFIELVSGLVVRRLHFTSAAALIDHLPERFRSRLLDLPAGPNRAITAETISKEIASRFDVDRSEAKRLVGLLWDSLVSEESVPAAADVAEELPDDLRSLFVGLPEGSHASETSRPRSESPH